MSYVFDKPGRPRSDEAFEKGFAIAVAKEEALFARIEELKADIFETWQFGAPRGRSVLLAKTILAELQLRLGRSDP
jgi:hypothetical protein